MAGIEDKIAFAVAPAPQGNGADLVILGIPRGAWAYMADGKTHTFDLTRAGIPVKLVLFGGEDHGSIMKVLESHIAGQGMAYLDQRRADFGIKAPAEGKR